MKILFIHDRFGSFGGAESNILATANGLRRRGHEVALLHESAEALMTPEWEDVFRVRFPLAESLSADPLKSACSVFPPDVVYVHKLCKLRTGDLLQAINETPALRMVHDHELYCLRGYKYHYFSRQVCERALSPYCIFPCLASLKRSSSGRFPIAWAGYWAKRQELEANRGFTRLMVASDYMKQELLRNGFESGRIEICPPVPAAWSTAGNPGEAAWRERASSNLILYVGQLVRGKGVDVLLRSLAKVRAGFSCIILGEGSHRSYCEALSRKLGLEGRVSFVGHVDREGLAGYFARARCLAVSSVWPEPFGAVGLEAMTHSLPVVAFRAGAIPEWLSDGENGFLCPWMDEDAYARRLEILLADCHLARKMGERGRELLEERFDFESYLTRLEGLFDQVVGESGGLVHV
jgi:glycosyltransferase involved in cell wall biosynthesis